MTTDPTRCCRSRIAWTVGGLAASAAVAAGLRYRAFVAGLEPRRAGRAITVRTDDGWNLDVRVYDGSGGDRRVPVVMGHGFAGSSLIWDLEPDVSLARYLAARGHDVYCVDLRGRAGSWPDQGPDPEAQWSFDDFVNHDVPAVVAAACEMSTAASCAWVGLEMSGQALYAAAASGTTPAICAGVTLGSPVITPPEAKVPGVTSTPLARRKGRVQFHAGAHHAGPILALLRSSQLESSFRPPNVDPVVPARYLRHGIPDESVVLADQFKDWVEHKVMRSVDRSTVWSDQLDRLSIPLLILAAAKDLQRPPAAVLAAADHFPGADVTTVEVGRANGFTVDYGHDDLVAARTSPVEVFPLIADWLAAHTPT